MRKYIIKVIRQGPTSGIKGTHYYNGEDSCGNSYKIMLMAGHANTFTKQETKKNIKKIELIYKKYSHMNGTLLKIEVLDAETLKIVSMCESEPEEIISRFELMEL